LSPVAWSVWRPYLQPGPVSSLALSLVTSSLVPQRNHSSRCTSQQKEVCYLLPRWYQLWESWPPGPEGLCLSPSLSPATQPLCAVPLLCASAPSPSLPETSRCRGRVPLLRVAKTIPLFFREALPRCPGLFDFMCIPHVCMPLRLWALAVS